MYLRLPAAVIANEFSLYVFLSLSVLMVTSELGLTEASVSRKDRGVEQKHPNLACLQMVLPLPTSTSSHVTYLGMVSSTGQPLPNSHHVRHATFIVRDLGLRDTNFHFALCCPLLPPAAVILSLMSHI